MEIEEKGAGNEEYELLRCVCGVVIWPNEPWCPCCGRAGDGRRLPTGHEAEAKKALARILAKVKEERERGEHASLRVCPACRLVIKVTDGKCYHCGASAVSSVEVKS
jgi:hypothetical protein